MTRLAAACLPLVLAAAACSAAPGVDLCPRFCPMYYSPLCASDGVTYGNSCMMQGAACRSGKTLTVVSAGPCKKQQADDSITPAIQKRACQPSCYLLYRPVCASDGQTYSNTCFMNAAACQKGVSLSKVSDGECEVSVRSAALDGAKDCNTICPMIYKPVCGSDGITYGNECEMTAAACEAGKIVKVASDGECPEKTAADPAPKDKCLGFCPMIYLPVCGSDGKTYANDCDMKHAACVKGEPITAVHQGTCDEKAAPCQTACIALYMPVCASDGLTYSNECVMKSSACKAGLSLTVVSQGECPVSGASCKTKPCSKIYDPVCGSDKKMYGNQCLFSNEQCEQKILGKELKEMSALYCTLKNL